MNEKFLAWDTHIDPRIDALVKHNFYIEAFYLSSSTIEFLLQMIIVSQEEWMGDVVQKRGFKFKARTVKELDKETLGQLIKIFSGYCSDERLIQDLNEYKELRNTIHNLLVFDIKQLNNLAKRKFTVYYSLVSKLCRYGMKLNEKKVRSIKREIKKIKGATTQNESKI